MRSLSGDKIDPRSLAARFIRDVELGYDANAFTRRQPTDAEARQALRADDVLKIATAPGIQPVTPAFWSQHHHKIRKAIAAEIKGARSRDHHQVVLERLTVLEDIWNEVTKAHAETSYGCTLMPPVSWLSCATPKLEKQIHEAADRGLVDWEEVREICAEEMYEFIERFGKEYDHAMLLQDDETFSRNDRCALIRCRVCAEIVGHWDEATTHRCFVMPPVNSGSFARPWEVFEYPPVETRKAYARLLVTLSDAPLDVTLDRYWWQQDVSLTLVPRELDWLGTLRNNTDETWLNMRAKSGSLQDVVRRSPCLRSDTLGLAALVR